MNNLLTISQVAVKLGISEGTLYNWISQKKIDYIKVNRQVRFSEEQLQRWIDKHTVKAQKKIA